MSASPRTRERVIVAMSGGVDSSVAAALLVGAGYDVVGVSMRLADEKTSGGSSGCCSLDDFRDAARVAGRLGIPHYIFDMRQRFAESVVRPFVEEYLAGRTPSPCILCNREIKFSLLRTKARELGAGLVATGHYARRLWQDGRYRLARGIDHAKDQSYFLFELGQAELAATLFPVGDLSKNEVRAIAEREGLAVADKPDSQEICFVADGRYADFVERAAAERVRRGAIVDTDGRVLGEHKGVHHYTVGQRRGLGVAAAEPLYVSALDAAASTVTVVPRDGLARAGLVGADVRWTSGRALSVGTRFQVRVRHRHVPVDCVLEEARGDRVTLRFAEPQEGISPGQAAVFYEGDEVLGGAWIRHSLACPQAEARCA